MDLTNTNKDRKDNWKDYRKRRTSLDLSTMVYGKVPPQAKDLEEAILGAVMLDKRAIDIVMELLGPECFYVDAHQRIYKAMLELAKRYQPIDIMMVVEELKRLEELEMVGGPYYVTRLTNSVVSSANIESHCLIVKQKFIAREIIRIGGEMISDAYEDSTDVFDLLNDVESNVLGISLSHLRHDFSSFDDGLVDVIKQLEYLKTVDHSITGVPSGFRRLDRCTCGWQDTDLIILAARPAVGKTAFALNLARNAVLDKFKPTPIGFFSLEMSKRQLIQRILSAESEIWLENIRRGKLQPDSSEQLYRGGIHKLGGIPFYIDDSAGLNLFELRSKARRMKQKHGVGLIIIDYLQLMTGAPGKNTNREQEISQISRGLKTLAKDLEVPIIALSQMSREVEKRADREPVLADLRESGAIEQDADAVMFLYRPSKKDIDKNPELKNTAMLKIAKNRQGDLDEIEYQFDGKIQKFTEMLEEGAGGVWAPVQLPLTGPAPKNFSEPEKQSEPDDDMPF